MLCLKYWYGATQGMLHKQPYQRTYKYYTVFVGKSPEKTVQVQGHSILDLDIGFALQKRTSLGKIASKARSYRGSMFT